MQLDVENAFLHGDIDREKYVSIPQGIEVAEPERFVCHLNKAIYGLATVPKQLFHWVSFGVNGNQRKFNAYFNMDDILVTGNSNQEITKTINGLGKIFEIEITEESKVFVGIGINRKYGKLFLNQKSYTNRVIEKYMYFRPGKVRIELSSFSIPPLSEIGRLRILDVQNFPYRHRLLVL